MSTGFLMSTLDPWLHELHRSSLMLIPALLTTSLLIVVLLLQKLPWIVIRSRSWKRPRGARVDPALLPKETLEQTEKLQGLIIFGSRLVLLGTAVGLASGLASAPWNTVSYRLLPAALWALTFVLVALTEVNGLVPWFNPGFRDFAWKAAQWSGKVRSGARNLLIWVLLALPPIALVLTVSQEENQDAVSILVGGLALLLLVAAFRARRRIIIQPFAEPKDDSALTGVGTEIAARLQHELARIQSLYEVVDEVMPEMGNKSLGVTMSVEDIGEIFKEAVGPSSKIKVAGLVEIPIGAILSAIGFFVRGPRITGSLLREESPDPKSPGFLLLAEISGGGQSGTWQVSLEEKEEVQAIFQSEAGDLGEEPAQNGGQPGTAGPGKTGQAGQQATAGGLSGAERAELTRLVELLACRIFTSLVPSGSPRWQAVRHFTEGLRAYRRTQRTKRRKPPQLHEAEREFLLALGEDTQFARCHCNLGVVYNQMELKDAEEASLRQALAQDPTAVDAYLGLAFLRFDQGEPQSAGRHSDNGLRIDPWHPRLWNLRGVSLLRCHTREIEWKRREDPAWKQCLPYLRIATALASREMVRAAGPGRPALVAKARRVLTICLGNLALATASAGDLGAARRLFRQALRLGDDPWWLAFELGRALYLAPAKSRAKRLKLLREAEIALDRVYDEALDSESRFELDLYLLGTHLALKAEDEKSGNKRSLHQPKVEDAYAYVLDQMALGGWDEKRMHLLEDVEEPLQGLGDDATGHFAHFVRLRALSRAVPLLIQDVTKPNGKAEAGERERRIHTQHQLQIWDEGLGWLESKLDEDGLPPYWSQKPSSPGPMASLSAMQELMEVLEVGWPPSDGAEAVSAWRRKALELRAQREEDWAWLHAQVRLHRAQAILEGKDRSRLAATAAVDLENAIEKLYENREHGLQIRDQWLYRCLAKAYLLDALKGERPSRDLLCKAVKAGRKAVAWNPQEPTGFLVLGQIYAALGDWPQARGEWEKALSFGTTPDIWLAIAETYLSHTHPPFLLGAETHAELMERMRFLQEGLDQVESRPAGDHDDSWLQAHGAIHLCLGLAQLDLGLDNEAVANLSTACSLGYCPVDATIALAKTHANLKKDSGILKRDLEGAEEELKMLPEEEREAAQRRICEARKELGIAA